MEKVTVVLNKHLERAKLVDELKAQLPIEWFVCKRLQECYDVFKILRAELVKRRVEVPETHIAGPVISRWVISVIPYGDERISALRRYDELRAERIRTQRTDASPDINSHDGVADEFENSEEKRETELEYTAQGSKRGAPNVGMHNPG